MNLTNIPDMCGLLKIPPDKIVPYVIVDQLKYVPIRSFPDYHKLNVETRVIDIRDLSNLKFCSRGFGKNDDMSAQTECTVATIDDIQKCLNIQYEEYQPDDALKQLIECKKEDMENGDIVRIKVESNNTEEYTREIATSDSYQNSNSSGEYKFQEIGNVSYLNMVNYYGTPIEKSGHQALINCAPSDLEIEEQKKLKMDKLKIKRSSRLANETEEQRSKRLLQLRIRQAERLAKETPEQREIRLSKLRFYQHRRLANETEEQRQKRLLQLRINQSLRLARKRNAALEQKMNKTVNDSKHLIHDSPSPLNIQDPSNTTFGTSHHNNFTNISNYSTEPMTLPMNLSDNTVQYSTQPSNHLLHSPIRYPNHYPKDLSHPATFPLSQFPLSNIHHPMEFVNNPIDMVQRSHQTEN